MTPQLDPHQRFMVARQWFLDQAPAAVDEAARHLTARTGYIDQVHAAIHESHVTIGDFRVLLRDRDPSEVRQAANLADDEQFRRAGAMVSAAVATVGLVYRCPHATVESLLVAPVPLVFMPRRGLMTCRRMECVTAAPGTVIIPDDECDLCRAKPTTTFYSMVTQLMLYTTIADVCAWCTEQLALPVPGGDRDPLGR